jgi:tetratricopeptide (TPR) repeat protein
MMDSKRRRVGGALVLILMALAAYQPALLGGYLWDDEFSVEGNDLLRSVQGLWRIWAEPSAIPHEEHYWPLTYTSLWVDTRIWGPRPFGPHLSNVLLHGANCVLLWGLLARLAVPGAWLASAAFALHPVHVESVAWIIERKDLLCAFFYLLAAAAYLRFLEERGRRAFLWSVGFFLCALLSKSTAVSFPLAMLLLVWWKKGKADLRNALAIGSLVVLAVGISVADMAFTARIQTATQGGKYELGFSFPERVLLAARALCFYASKVLWPANLMTIYPRWNIAAGEWSLHLSLLAVAGTICALWLLRGRIGRGPLVAVLFFCIALAPALGFVDFVFMRLSFVADRFQYLASLGPIALFTGAGARFADRLGGPRRGALSLGATGAVLGVLGALSWRQSALYESQITLFRHNVAGNPEAWFAHHNLGVKLAERGETAEGIRHLERALELKPDYAMARHSLGQALNNLGAESKRAGRLEEAADLFRRALDCRPSLAEAHYNLGVVLTQLGRPDEALSHYDKAVGLRPDFAEAQKEAGVLCEVMGRMEEAIERLSAALKLRPDWPEAAVELAWILSTEPDRTLRNGPRAVELAEMACRSKGGKDNAAYLDTLAAAYAEAGRFQKAEQTAREAGALARTAGQLELAAEIEARQRLYAAGSPYHQGAAP